jgi:hypothetical protein
MIFWHIFAYLFILTANTAQFFTLGSLYDYEVSTFFCQAINLACNVILALIVNQIVSRALITQNSDWSGFAYTYTY